MSMTMCENQHELIVYENYDHHGKRSLKCPLCHALDEISKMQEEVDEIEIEKAESEVDPAKQKSDKIMAAFDNLIAVFKEAYIPSNIIDINDVCLAAARDSDNPGVRELAMALLGLLEAK